MDEWSSNRSDKWVRTLARSLYSLALGIMSRSWLFFVVAVVVVSCGTFGLFNFMWDGTRRDEAPQLSSEINRLRAEVGQLRAEDVTPKRHSRPTTAQEMAAVGSPALPPLPPDAPELQSSPSTGTPTPSPQIPAPRTTVNSDGKTPGKCGQKWSCR